MKQKHRILLIALITSVIITTIISGIILINTRQTERSHSAPQAFLMEGIVDDVSDEKPYLPYWQLSVIIVICFVILTTIFYIVIKKIKKV